MSKEEFLERCSKILGIPGAPEDIIYGEILWALDEYIGESE